MNALTNEDLPHEHEFEPANGLPEPLPQGEAMLWQGSPSARAMTLRVMHVRMLCAYFAVLLGWRGVSVLSDTGSLAEAAWSVAWLAPLAAMPLAIVAGLAWLCARTTVYTITSRRVVMRVGIVLTVTFNLPFRSIESAGLRVYADGTGDIPLVLKPGDRIAYLNLWPHARPWRLARPQPMLRVVPDAARVADTLARAAIAASGGALRAGTPVARPTVDVAEPLVAAR